MNKKIFPIIFGIFLISLISAQVTIQPNPINISQLVSQTKTYSITINNSFDFDIQDLKFGNLTNLGFTFPNTTTFRNSTREINFSVTPTSSFSGTRTEKIEFKFIANIPTTITTYPINITQVGFNPTNIIIRAGDTISFTNKDTIFHNVFSSQFNQNINPNETFSFTFNNLGIYDFSDQNWNQFNGFRGTIEVISRTSGELVHNPTYDFNWDLNINFFLNPTNITYELLEDNFNVQASGKTEGLVKLLNIGNERAERVNLASTSNWISFQENNFNLEPNEQNIVTYEINPLIFTTNETNKTYTINLTVSGSNIQTQSKQISVFIPFTEVFEDKTTSEFIFALLDKFCKANPNVVFCNPERNITITGNGTNQTITFNGTSFDLSEILRRLSGIETTSTRQENKISGFEDLYNTKLGNIENNATASYLKQIENEQKARRDKNVRWIIGTTLLISTCIAFIFWRWKKVRRKISLKEGAYEYRY